MNSYVRRTPTEVERLVLMVCVAPVSSCSESRQSYICAEFAGLWKYISDWQGVFAHFDRDRSGSIDGHELANALASFGYNLTPQILSLIEQKYGTRPP